MKTNVEILEMLAEIRHTIKTRNAFTGSSGKTYPLWGREYVLEDGKQVQKRCRTKVGEALHTLEMLFAVEDAPEGAQKASTETTVSYD